MSPIARALTPASIALRTQALPASRTVQVWSRSYADARDPPKKVHRSDEPTKEAHAGRQERVSGTYNSQATSEKGGAHYADKAKQEHPKAPEPIIGMNDERGAKGH